jgi:hypothetical protein
MKAFELVPQPEGSTSFFWMGTGIPIWVFKMVGIGLVNTQQEMPVLGLAKLARVARTASATTAMSLIPRLLQGNHPPQRR